MQGKTMSCSGHLNSMVLWLQQKPGIYRAVGKQPITLR